ncbi:MAG TPA: hypothetical protein VFZ85_18645 [Jiangellaceae bacterium]
MPVDSAPQRKNTSFEETPEVAYDRSPLTDAEVEGFGAPDRHNR